MPDPTKPECVECSGQEPGTPAKPVKLVHCSYCDLPYCNPCFSLHRSPDGFEEAKRSGFLDRLRQAVRRG